MHYMTVEEARRMELRIAKWESALAPEFLPELVSLKSDPAWLRLPIAKKEVGLKRYRVMLEYDRGRVRTEFQAKSAADEIGMKLRSFYALYKLWRDSNREWTVLVPFATEISTRRSRLSDEVSFRLTTLAQNLVISFPTDATGSLLSQLRELWGEQADRPSDVTIRSYLERAREEHSLPPGSISAESLGYNKHLKAGGFGDVLIIDHTAPADILTPTSGGIVPPTVTLVLDEFTGSPIGAACNDRQPCADLVSAALADARKRLARLAPACNLKGATVLYSATLDREWRGLSDDLIASGYFVNERLHGCLSPGFAIRHLIGTSLDEVLLHSGRALRKEGGTEIDPERKTLLKIEDVRLVIEDAVDKIFERRVPISEREREPTFQQPTIYTDTQFQDEPYDDIEPGWTPIDVDKAMQRALEEHFRLRKDRNCSPQIATIGYSASSRSPEVFRRQIERLVRKTAKDRLISMKVVEPKIGQPSWDISVVVDDVAACAPIWLELAREAIDLAEMELTFVQFNVNAAAGRFE